MSLRQVTPSSIAQTTITVKGRVYTCAVGSAIIVPSWDAAVLEGNGWTGIDAGTTAQRPANATKGNSYYDTTVGAVIHHDGKVWRNLTTGASV